VICSDGTSNVLPAISFKLGVDQYINNTITLTQEINNTLKKVSVSGVTVLSSTGMKGKVYSDSTFTTSEKTTMSMKNIQGMVYGLYDVEGVFTPNGWDGIYTITMTYPVKNCTSKYTFTGNRI